MLDAAEAQRLANAECAEHKRFARMAIKGDSGKGTIRFLHEDIKKMSESEIKREWEQAGLAE